MSLEYTLVCLVASTLRGYPICQPVRLFVGLPVDNCTQLDTFTPPCYTLLKLIPKDVDQEE